MGGSTNRPSDNATTNQLLKGIAQSNDLDYPSDDDEIDVQMEMHRLLDLHFQAIQRQFNDLHLELVRDWEPEVLIMSDNHILSKLHSSSPIRRPRRLDNNEDIDYSEYLEKLNREHAQLSSSPPTGDLKRKSESDTSDAENKKSKN
ncbi:unnamed protein product [Caenorhabditis brenneri]